MNYLEKKAIRVVREEQDKAFSKIDNIRNKIRSVTNSEGKEKIALNYETLIKELESLLDNDMHSISEWLHALESNH